MISNVRILLQFCIGYTLYFLGYFNAVIQFSIYRLMHDVRPIFDWGFVLPVIKQVNTYCISLFYTHYNLELDTYYLLHYDNK